ncbi:MAG TPA: hypothetical protein VFN91_04965 [Myxococcaceae bacterium]|nr:hypothetical protein [Myxococcaceae bacterium]
MTSRKYWWLLVPLAAALGCAGSQQEQKVTKAGGNSTLVDEGPAKADAQGAGAAGAAAGTAGAAAGAAATGQPAQLVQFQGANGFTVLMPPNPEKNERTQDTPGGPVQVHIAQAQDPSGKYMSSLSEFPKGSLNKVKSKDLLDSLQQATVQSMGGTLTNSQDIQVGGLAGREFSVTDPEGSQVTARVFVGDSRVYTLAGTYPKGEVPPSIKQFLGSFQPPAGTAVGGSGAPDAASGTGAVDSADSVSSSDSSVTSAPDSSTKSKKKSRRSTSTDSTTSADAAGSR